MALVLHLVQAKCSQRTLWKRTQLSVPKHVFDFTLLGSSVQKTSSMQLKQNWPHSSTSTESFELEGTVTSWTHLQIASSKDMSWSLSKSRIWSCFEYLWLKSILLTPKTLELRPTKRWSRAPHSRWRCTALQKWMVGHPQNTLHLLSTAPELALTSP